MKIQSVQYITPAFSYRASQRQENSISHPVKDGLTTAGIWFGFGVALDLVSRNVIFSKSPMKNSIAINSIIASTAGAVTGLSTARKANRD